MYCPDDMNGKESVAGDQLPFFGKSNESNLKNILASTWLNFSQNPGEVDVKKISQKRNISNQAEVNHMKTAGDTLNRLLNNFIWRTLN